MRKTLRSEKGFTLIEMMVVLLVITVLILIALPNVTNQSKNINKKGCDALVQMVQGQVEAYRMEKNTVPTVGELHTAGYLRDADTKCPNGKELLIDTDGTVTASDS